ncbi:MAG: GNAT family N-acetyltransferase [Rhodospirillaceae bacterium]|nr:GNAT family N-acetyltransferase [Rhodospirillaceae bacterium]
MSASVTVEALTPDSADLLTVAAWLNAEWGRELGYTLDETIAWCRDVANSSVEDLLVARQQDICVGSAMLLKDDLYRGDELSPWLSSLYVRPENRGKDVGAALASAAIECATRHGIDIVYLYAEKGKLIDYYRRLGWFPYAMFERDDKTFIIMRTRLPAGVMPMS